MPKIQFICLANSRKLQGRCVAGLRIDKVGWIRPVSNGPGGTISQGECILDDGNEVTPLDVVEVEVTKPKPEVYQPENWELARGMWHLVKRLTPSAAIPLLDPVVSSGPTLIENNSDRVLHSPLSVDPVTASLAIIEPRDLQWQVTTSFRGNRQTRCIFNLAGADYNLSVTDSHIEQKLSSHPGGVHPRSAAVIDPKAHVLLTVSLGEPFGGWCYKLVVAVIVL